MDESLCDTAPAAWFEERARLNHDFLLNQVLIAVTAALGRPEDSGTADRLLRFFLARAASFTSLLRDAPEVLRPGTWAMHEGLLGDFQSEVAAELLDLLYLRGSSIPAACRQAQEDLECAVTAVNEALHAGTSDALSSAESALQHLSKALSRLPSTMSSVVETM
jgi:hypothetical protein